MTLTDAGALIGLLDRLDASHSACVAAAGNLPPGPLLSTWPCFTETMYLLGSRGGWHYQSELWRLRRIGRLILHDLTPDETNRMAVLMEQYRNVPMDLADASLVVVAESRSMRQIFTLDSDFHIYRLADGSTLQVIP